MTTREKKIKICLNIVAMVLSAMVCGAQTNTNTTVADFNKLLGSWKGSLTYLDYSSGKPYTMPADIKIDRIGNTSQYSFSNIYPNEPKANSIDTFIISADGSLINKELIKSRKILAKGNIELVTEELGKDGNDNKDATIRHTYTFGKMKFRIIKEIQFIGEQKWIKRHEYSYSR